MSWDLTVGPSFKVTHRNGDSINLSRLMRKKNQTVGLTWGATCSACGQTINSVLAEYLQYYIVWHKHQPQQSQMGKQPMQPSRRASREVQGGGTALSLPLMLLFGCTSSTSSVLSHKPRPQASQQSSSALGRWTPTQGYRWGNSFIISKV